MQTTEHNKRFTRPDGLSVFDSEGRYIIHDRTYAKNRERVDALPAYDTACSKALGVIQNAVNDIRTHPSFIERMDQKHACWLELAFDELAAKFARHVDLNLLHLNAVLESMETGWPYGMWGNDLDAYLRDEEARIKKAREINEGRKE